MTEFFDAIRSPVTKKKYERNLEFFFVSAEIEGQDLNAKARNFTRMAKQDNAWATQAINVYMRKQKDRAERKEISEATVPNFFKPIKLFCEMNDIILNWKKISKRIPRGRSYGQDRTPSLEEVKQILAYPDRRVKPVALTMLSSGVRLGAFDYLDWGHVEPIKKGGQAIAAKIRVYAGTPDEYWSFITPECLHSLQEYIDFRASNGERIGKNSPLIRDLFYPDRLGKGEPHIPKRLKSSGVKRMMEDALRGTGIRKALTEGKKRHEFQADHGFRKFFKSTAEKHMKSLHVEMLMGHNVGLAENYFRPSEQDLLTDYARAIPDLTILERPPSPNTKKIEELEKDGEALKKEVAEIRARLEQLAALLNRR
jgi:integrase